MDKNIYSLFGTSNQFDINFTFDYGLHFLCFKLYRHKTKPDVWVIKDISIGPLMKGLPFGSLHEEMIEKLYNHIVSFLIDKYAVRLMIFEVFAGSLWYIFEYSAEQAQLISTYPKIIDFETFN